MKRSYIKGIIGALIGGLIASIPWVIVYVYLNLIYSILAFFVAMGAVKGYMLFKGKITKKLPTIITIISLLSITIATLVIIPSLLILKEDLSLTIANLQYLYSNSEFVGAIIKDYIISILFTFLGISGVTKTLKTQIEQSGENININIGNDNSKKERNKVKKFFIEKNATTEENAIALDSTMDINFYTVNILVSENIINVDNGKYYYNLSNENKVPKKKKNIAITTAVSIIIIAIIVGVASYFSQKEDKEEAKDVYYYVMPSFKEYVDEEFDDSWLYFPKSDLSGYSGYISVYYYESTENYSEEWVSTYIDTMNLYYEVESTNHFTNKHGNDVAYFKIATEEDYNFITYYIFDEGNVGVVNVIDYIDNNELFNAGERIADTFYWID